MKKIAVLVLALAGAVFVAISSPEVLKSKKLKMSGISTEGTAVSVVSAGSKSELDRVTAVFRTSEGGEITATGYKRGYVRTGDKVKLWYDKSDPQIITFGDAAGYNMRAVILGGLLFIAGLYFFIRYTIQDISGKKLLASGMKISAELTLVQDERFRAGPNNPWLIKARWRDIRNNKEYNFQSKLYTIDPRPYLNGRSNIDVYINPDNPLKYHMDVSFMPKGNNTIG